MSIPIQYQEEFPDADYPVPLLPSLPGNISQQSGESSVQVFNGSLTPLPSSDIIKPSNQYIEQQRVPQRRLKLIVTRHTQKHPNLDTPAMRVKTRPKRPNQQIILPDPDIIDDDYTDEDYLGPHKHSKKHTVNFRTNFPIQSADNSSHYILSNHNRDLSSKTGSQMINDIYKPLKNYETFSSTSTTSFQASTPSSQNSTFSNSTPYSRVDDESPSSTTASFPNVSTSTPSTSQILTTQTQITSNLGDLQDVLFQPNENGVSWEESKFQEGFYINCDIRYLDLRTLGKFEIVLVDPYLVKTENIPSERTSNQQNPNLNDSYTNFTITSTELMDLEVEYLSDSGICFLWTSQKDFPLAIKCLEKWQYTYVDQFAKNSQIGINMSHNFVNSNSMYLIGVKGSFQFHIKHFLDVLYEYSTITAQHPQRLFNIIEGFWPSSTRVELFGTNDSIRPGWLTLGHRLGEQFTWLIPNQYCQTCSLLIQPGEEIYKHRTHVNHVWCKKCLTYPSTTLIETEYFLLENKNTTLAFHPFFSCDGCNVYPIWGIRFSCEQCPLNFCEACYYMHYIPEEYVSMHKLSHKFKTIENPINIEQLPIHKVRCSSCSIFPIKGEYYFKCKYCPETSFCQKCFFNGHTHCLNQSHTQSDETLQVISKLNIFNTK